MTAIILSKVFISVGLSLVLFALLIARPGWQTMLSNHIGGLLLAAGLTLTFFP
jgi:hypothetical protein